MELKDKIVVITGGASGIGKALAERAHAEGAAHVVVVDRDADGAAAVAASVSGTAATVDVTDEAAIAELIVSTERDIGPIDLFVSNAGYVTLGGLEAPVEDLNRMWEVHVLAHLYAARAVIPHMADRGHGYLLNTASAAGLLSQFGSLHYAVTKHAAVALAEWIAITHGHQGVKVSVLCPQAVDTNIIENSPNANALQTGGADVAGADGHLSAEEAVDVVVEALREERFHVLPHPEVGEYYRRKGDDVDRWIGGMQRWQEKMFTDDLHPATWLTGR
jgi:NAD(P)-dependent dehydrogenase (short-subunit alcohol dehydrogenase family)